MIEYHSVKKKHYNIAGDIFFIINAIYYSKYETAGKFSSEIHRCFSAGPLQLRFSLESNHTLNALKYLRQMPLFFLHVHQFYFSAAINSSTTNIRCIYYIMSCVIYVCIGNYRFMPVRQHKSHNIYFFYLMNIKSNEENIS